MSDATHLVTTETTTTTTTTAITISSATGGHLPSCATAIHPFAIAYASTRLVFHRRHHHQHQPLLPPGCTWSSLVWLRLLRQHQLTRHQHTATMQPTYQLIPIPQQLYATLVADEFLHSDHYALIPEALHDRLVTRKAQHWRQLVFQSADTATIASDSITPGTVTAAILKRPNASVLVACLPIPGHTPLQPDAVFVSENCYQNCVQKFKLLPTADDKEEEAAVRVQLQPMQRAQRCPQLATRATIFTLKQPYEVSNEVVDEILACYFRRPRILYRNYTYAIQLDAQLLGTPFCVRNAQLLQHLRWLHFRCVHLESEDNQFELAAVVVRQRTALQQTTSINMALPRRELHGWCPGLAACPGGLGIYFDALRASLRPFCGNLLAPGTPTSNGNGNGKGGPISATPPADYSSLTSMPLLLLQGERGAGKQTVLHAVAASLGFPVMHVDCTDIVSASAAHTETKLRLALARAAICRPLIVALLNFELFGVDGEGREDVRAISMFATELAQFFGGTGDERSEREGSSDDSSSGASSASDQQQRREQPTIVVAVSNERETKPAIRRLFVDTVRVEPLDKKQRAEALRWLHTAQQIAAAIREQRATTIPLCQLRQGGAFLQRYCRIGDVLTDFADRTAGFLFGDVKLLYGNSVTRMQGQRKSSLGAAELEHNLQQMQALFADSLGAPKVPRVLWSDIGGLAKLKEEIQQSIGMPLKHMHLMGRNLRRSGILLYGPPGTGKTLVAKAVATECNLSFLSVQGPELLNMYVGQSEQNVREVFARARSAAPCVVFLDELDSLAPNRGMAGDSGGVMDRVVSQLMTEMNGMADDADPTKQLFILAATNRPDLIDPSLLRPGRFDKLLYVGPCTTTDEKMAVFDTQTKKFNMDAHLGKSSIAKILPKAGMTGADMYSICSNAWLGAVRRTIYDYEARRSSAKSVAEVEAIAEPTADDVIVKLTDFAESARQFVPSVSAKDMEYFIKLKASFSVA